MTPRDISTIQKQIISSKQAQSVLSGLTSPSQVSNWRLWTFIVAVSQSLLEQIFSLLQLEIETTVATAAPETAAWVQAQVFLFQYSDSLSQVVQINSDFSISYPVIDPTLRIITNCAVLSNGNGGLIIKVTKSGGVLSVPEIAALTSYLNEILGADISFSIVNKVPDILDIIGTIYYIGQYSGTIQNDVVNAITNYLATLKFNSTIKLSDIMDVIRNVGGVTDFKPDNIYATPNGGTASYLVNTSLIISREYQTVSGQITYDTGASVLTFSIDNN